MLNSCLNLNIQGVKKADDSRYANGLDIRLVNLCLIASLSKFKLTTSCGKPLEDIIHAHIVSLMYKLTTSAKDTDDLSIRFEGDCERRRDELTHNKNKKGKNHVRILLKDVFGFAEHQEKATYDIGYQIILTRNKDEAVVDKAAGIGDATIKIDIFHWYVLQYTPSIPQQGKLSKQTLGKTPTELRYIERSVFMKEAKIKTYKISN